MSEAGPPPVRYVPGRRLAWLTLVSLPLYAAGDLGLAAGQPTRVDVPVLGQPERREVRVALPIAPELHLALRRIQKARLHAFGVVGRQSGLYHLR